MPQTLALFLAQVTSDTTPEEAMLKNPLWLVVVGVAAALLVAAILYSRHVDGRTRKRS